MTYRLSDPAIQDLEEIYAFVAARSRPAAGAPVDQFTERFERLAEMPGMGRRRKELARGLRSSIVGYYLIFCRQSEGAVEIVRVPDGSRDVERQFQ